MCQIRLRHISQNNNSHLYQNAQVKKDFFSELNKHEVKINILANKL